MGYYRDEADSISLDIQQFVKEEVEYLSGKLLKWMMCGFSQFCLSLFCFGCQSFTAFNFRCHDAVLFVVLQVDFKCDVVLDTGPVTPKVVSVLPVKDSLRRTSRFNCCII